MGVTYYARYLEYFECGGTWLLRELGAPCCEIEEDGVTAVTVENGKTGKSKVAKTQGVFAYLGIRPHTAWLRGTSDLVPDGYAITDELLDTPVPRMFAAGDVRNKTLPFFQIVGSASDGAFAALAAEKYAERRKNA